MQGYKRTINIYYKGDKILYRYIGDFDLKQFKKNLKDILKLNSTTKAIIMDDEGAYLHINEPVPHEISIHVCTEPTLSNQKKIKCKIGKPNYLDLFLGFDIEKNIIENKKENKIQNEIDFSINNKEEKKNDKINDEDEKKNKTIKSDEQKEEEEENEEEEEEEDEKSKEANPEPKPKQEPIKFKWVIGDQPKESQDVLSDDYTYFIDSMDVHNSVSSSVTFETGKHYLTIIFSDNVIFTQEFTCLLVIDAKIEKNCFAFRKLDMKKNSVGIYNKEYICSKTFKKDDHVNFLNRTIGIYIDMDEKLCTFYYHDTQEKLLTGEIHCDQVRVDCWIKKMFDKDTNKKYEAILNNQGCIDIPDFVSKDNNL